VFKRGNTRRLRLQNSATFSGIAINVAVNAAGAEGRRMEPAVHLFDFLFVQLPCAFAEQHPVLIIHYVSPFANLGPLQAQASKSLRAALLRRAARQGGTYQMPPHSVVSPSAPPAKLKVHAVKVWIPPPTWAVSCSFNSRAFWRSNTLFWSFMFTLLV
jgi:hypothetical protein